MPKIASFSRSWPAASGPVIRYNSKDYRVERNMPASLRIQLLGGLRLIQGDSVLWELDAPSLRSPLTYLLLRRALPVSR